MRHVLVLSLIVLVLSPAAARAGGCEKDTDCKFDRICVEGACVDPPMGTATSTGTTVAVPSAEEALELAYPSDLDWKRIKRYWLAARGHSAAGWVFTGMAVTSALAAFAVGSESQNAAAGTGGLATLFWGIGIPLTSGAHATARRGYEQFNKLPVSYAARGASWALYSIGITCGVGAVGVSIAEVDGVGYGLGACAVLTLIPSAILMQVHAAQGLRLLRAGIEVNNTRAAAPRQPVRAMAMLAPTPGARGVPAGVQGAFHLEF